MDDLTAVIGTATSIKTRPKAKPKAVQRLRDLPPLSPQFWKAQLDDYLAQQVLDKTHDGSNDRWLPPNEIDALALNEIAVARGNGFFMFLPNRNSWARQTFDPKSRGPRPDGLRASVPSLVFMRYAWSESSRAKYTQSAQRARYVACDFQLNPPPPATPLYCLQVVSDARYATYTTNHPSFLLIRANPLYFGSVADMGAIIGPPARKRQGPDAQQRLGQIRVWGEHTVDIEFKQFRQESLERLYDTIVNTCHPTTSPSSMTSSQLCDTLPRPPHPQIGLMLGQNAAQARSRRGGRLDRGVSVEESEQATASGSVA